MDTCKKKNYTFPPVEWRRRDSHWCQHGICQVPPCSIEWFPPSWCPLEPPTSGHTPSGEFSSPHTILVILETPINNIQMNIHLFSVWRNIEYLHVAQRINILYMYRRIFEAISWVKNLAVIMESPGKILNKSNLLINIEFFLFKIFKMTLLNTLNNVLSWTLKLMQII